MWRLGIPLAASLPFWLPTDWTLARAMVSVVAVVWCAKLLDLGRGRVDDPAMLDSPGRAVTWFLIPPDTRPARSDDDVETARSDGRGRLLRFIPKALAFTGLLVAASVHPRLHEEPVLGTLAGLVMVYVVIAGLADLVGGLAMQSGLWIDESFRAPLLSRSPADFWGRRWNLFVHRIAYRHVFLPARGLRRPLFASVLVFGASGVMHEYLIVAAVGGIPEHVGWMMAFFSIHGLAVMLELGLRRRRVPRLPRAAGIGLHLVWMLATGPLFLAPMDEAFSYTTWRLW